MTPSRQKQEAIRELMDAENNGEVIFWETILEDIIRKEQAGVRV